MVVTDIVSNSDNLNYRGSKVFITARKYKSSKWEISPLNNNYTFWWYLWSHQRGLVLSDKSYELSAEIWYNICGQKVIVLLRESSDEYSVQISRQYAINNKILRSEICLCCQAKQTVMSGGRVRNAEEIIRADIFYKYTQLATTV